MLKPVAWLSTDAEATLARFFFFLLAAEPPTRGAESGSGALRRCQSEPQAQRLLSFNGQRGLTSAISSVIAKEEEEEDAGEIPSVISRFS